MLSRGLVSWEGCNLGRLRWESLHLHRPPSWIQGASPKGRESGTERRKGEGREGKGEGPRFALVWGPPSE